MSDQSANNKRIAKNTLMLYIRMLFTMLVGLYTSRVVMQVLGVADYGLYNVVGGVVTMFTFVNGSMASGTQRFITFELGVGNMTSLKNVFSTSVVVHLFLSFIILILAETVGLWFVCNKMVFEPGREIAAMWVYQFSIISCLLSIIQVPFMASLIAHEKMNIYAYMSIYDAVVKLLIVFLVKWSSFDKLIYYAALGVLANLSSFMLYNWYCRKNYEECSFALNFDRRTFKRIFSFSVWDTVGSLASVGQAQGVNIVINMFCGTVVNAARGVSVTVNTMVMQFVNNFLVAVNPQLIKYCAKNQVKEMVRLTINSANLSTYLLLIIGIPVFVEIEFLLKIWLGVYPEYAPAFCRIILLQSLIQSMGTPTMKALHAIGNIRMMNILVGSLLLLILPASYFLFRIGFSPELVLLCNIIPWIVAIPIRLYLLHRYIGFPIWQYIYEVLIKGLFISGLIYVFPYCVFHIYHGEDFSRFLLVGLTSVFASVFVIYNVGLDAQLKYMLYSKVKSFFNKIRTKDEKENC